MHVTIVPNKEKPGFYTVIPDGPIDSDTHGQFREKINPILNKTLKGLVIDLANVNYISSAGFGVIFSLKKFMHENNGTLVFCHLKPQIKKLFDIMKALPHESLFETIEEADKYLYSIAEKEIKRSREASDK